MKEDLLRYWKASGMITDERVLQAFTKVPREFFVLPEFVSQAYDDIPLPILAGQTISQPSTVMIMVQALELQPHDRVLEIGAGSGYNAAIMAQLCKEVISTEIVPELVIFAKRNLKHAGITNAHVVFADGSQGYEKKAPYDKIIVTAASRSIPEPLMGQLKQQGILVAPVGGAAGQQMTKCRKTNGLVQEDLGTFTFVPLQGKYSNY